MVNNKSDHDDDKQLAGAMEVNTVSDEMDEDPILAESISSLAEVQMPAHFLPNVMFRVYEEHRREKLKLGFILVVSFILVLFSATYFALDVNAYREAQSLPSFQMALEQKLDLVREFSEGIVTGIAGIFSASWHIITGTVGMFIVSTSLLAKFLLVFAILGIIYLAKKALARMVGR